MRYVDGYVLPVPKKRLKTYRRLAQMMGKIWREHGALQVVEAVAEDISPKCGLPFPKLVKPKPGETIVFSWIVFKSRAHRDRVNAKVMKDGRCTDMAKDTPMPFEVERMAYGGFDMIVDV